MGRVYVESGHRQRRRRWPAVLAILVLVAAAGAYYALVYRDNAAPRAQQQPTTYSDSDLDVRQFLKKVSRRVARRGQIRAA